MSAELAPLAEGLAAVLTSLLDTAPAQRKPSIAWRLRHVEELAAGNFPALWRNTAHEDAG